MKTIFEECNNFVILLPAWLSWFVLYIFLMPQHNLVKDRKKDRLIFNAAKQLTMDHSSQPHDLHQALKELDCTFGTVMVDFLVSVGIYKYPSQNTALTYMPIMSVLVSDDSNTTLMSWVLSCSS